MGSKGAPVNAKDVTKRLARKAGFEVTRVRDARVLTGRDVGHDIKVLLQDAHHPVVLDVGANRGQSVQLFRELLPDCRIHSFEPGRAAYHELERSTDGLSDLRLNHVAVGAVSGRRRFLENIQDDMSSFLPIGKEGWGSITEEFEVSVITLDDYCSDMSVERVDVLKSDTQGYDLEVLKGAEGLFRDGRVGLVYTEVTFSRLYEDLPGFDVLYRFLADRDMRLVALYDYVMRDGVAAWCDALFARR